MNCLGCKHYKASAYTELGECMKHGLRMHYATVNEDCYEPIEKQKNNNDIFVNQCKKISELERSSITACFRQEAKYLISMCMGKLDKIEFSREQLEILEELTVSSISNILKEEAEIVKYTMIYSDKKDETESAVKTEKNYSYSTSGIEETETKVLKKVDNIKTKPQLDF